jgi:hypothetical protein
MQSTNRISTSALPPPRCLSLSIAGENSPSHREPVTNARGIPQEKRRSRRPAPFSAILPVADIRSKLSASTSNDSALYSQLRWRGLHGRNSKGPFSESPTIRSMIKGHIRGEGVTRLWDSLGATAGIHLSERISQLSERMSEPYYGEVAGRFGVR